MVHRNYLFIFLNKQKEQRSNKFIDIFFHPFKMTFLFYKLNLYIYIFFLYYSNQQTQILYIHFLIFIHIF